MIKMLNSLKNLGAKLGINKLISRTHPCFRCYARTVDVAIFTMVWAAFIKLADIHMGTYISMIVAVAAYIFVEATLLAFVGTTIGKYLFNIKVRDVDGKKPKYSEALYRTLKIMPFYSLPVIGFLFSGFTVKKLKENDSTIWDKGKFLVSHKKIGLIRAIIIIIVFGFILHTWVKSINRKQINQYVSMADKYASKIKYLNTQLPLLVGADVDVDLVHQSFEEKTISYTEEVTNRSVSQIVNVMDFNASMKEAALQSLCTKSDVASPFTLGYRVNITYVDKNNKEITTVKLAPRDCLYIRNEIKS